MTSLATVLLDTLTAWAALALRVIPYLLLGAATAAVLQAYVSPRWAARLLGSGTRSVWAAALLAALLPGCACATGPMSDGLRRRGASLGTVTAFLMMSPLLAPHTLLLTWGVLGWRFAVARATIPFLVVPLLGLVLNRLERSPGWRPVAPVMGGAPGAHRACGTDGGCADPHGGEPCRGAGPTALPRHRLFVAEWAATLRRVAVPFAVGLAVAAGLTVLVPEEAIPRTIGAAGPLAFLVAALLAMPIYVCEGEEVPLTAAALGLGLAPGPAFTFLLGAVGTCLPTMLMARRIIGGRATALYVGAWCAFAIGAGVLFQGLVGS